MNSPRANLRAIADLAGCSRMTVSLALRNDSQVSAATRERIQKFAREIGYQPDATMHALMAQMRSKGPVKFHATMAALHMVSRRLAARTHCYTEWLAGAASRAAQLGYTIDDFWLADAKTSPAKLERILKTRPIRGLLLPCVANAPALPDGFHFLLERYPCAIAGYPAPSLPRLPCATNDRFATGAALFERARVAGCRRIGAVVATDAEPLADERFASAILSASHRGDAQVVALPMLVCGCDSPGDFRAWFRKHQPDCVITSIPQVHGWMRALGVTFPGEVSFLFWQLARAHDEWSGARQNDLEIGAAAVELVVGQINRGDRGLPRVRTRVMIESSLIPGATLRKSSRAS